MTENIRLYLLLQIYCLKQADRDAFSGPNHLLKGKATLNIIKMKDILFPNILVQVS